MDADVDPRVSHNRRDPIEQEREPFQWLGEKEGGGEDVHRMGGREGIGSVTICEQVNILEHMAGPYASHPVFEQVAGKLVRDGQGHSDKN